MSTTILKRPVFRFNVIIVLGPPGSGKGTQCKKLAQVLDLPHVSTGDLLRDHVSRGTSLGLQARDVMNQGGLVPDEAVLEMLRVRISQADCQHGFVLDGFPRTRNQAEMLETCLAQLNGAESTSKWVFRLTISEEAILRRLAGRRTCPTCGKVYGRESLGICDVDGTELILRSDDREETVRTRLAVFAQTISPVFDYYTAMFSVVEVNADRAIDEVTNSILRELHHVEDQVQQGTHPAGMPASPAAINNRQKPRDRANG